MKGEPVHGGLMGWKGEFHFLSLLEHQHFTRLIVRDVHTHVRLPNDIDHTHRGREIGPRPNEEVSVHLKGQALGHIVLVACREGQLARAHR